MFKFDFQMEDEDVDVDVQGGKQSSTSEARVKGKGKEVQACYHVTLDELMESLPETISYSPLYHPSLKNPLLRRDLFDARFQLISDPSSSTNPLSPEESSRPSNGSAGKDGGEEYVDTDTDLIPGLYEGGLKTWEGGVDLVEVLAGVGSRVGDAGVVGEWVKGGSVLEVGCGTALPTAFLLRSLLESITTTTPSPPAPTSDTDASPTSNLPTTTTTFHLQDYNHLVLSLVTLPNLILATLPFLPPSLLVRSDPESTDPNGVAQQQEEVDLTQPGNLDLSLELLSAFRLLLAENGIELKFSYGDWSGFALSLRESSAGRVEGKNGRLVLTAETIYSEDSVDSLLAVLKASSPSRGGKGAAGVVGKNTKGQNGEEGIEKGLEGLKVGDDWAKRGLGESGETIVLVAAKVLYFGVGGGIQSFLSLVEQGGGWWVGVKDWIKGVGRKVVRIGW